jgi:hypothetical protein
MGHIENVRFKKCWNASTIINEKSSWYQRDETNRPIDAWSAPGAKLITIITELKRT